MSSNSPEELLLSLYRVVIAKRTRDLHVARSLGVGLNELAALDAVAGNPGLRLSDLQARLGLSSGATTTLADRLERGGFLERRRITEDRRGVALHATAEGLDRLHTAVGPLLQHLSTRVSALAPAHREGAAAFLALVLDALAEERGPS